MLFLKRVVVSVIPIRLSRAFCVHKLETNERVQRMTYSLNAVDFFVTGNNSVKGNECRWKTDT